MQDLPFHPSTAFAKLDLSFAKIVSIPKPGLAWSQAYNAGKLFAVLSLEKEIADEQTPDSLNILGKDLLSKLEEEFFTLDIKDIISIKQSISNTIIYIQYYINYSFAAVFVANSILFLFTIGNGTVFIRRHAKIGKSKTNQNENPKSIISASGFLKNNDLIILITNPLPDIIDSVAFSELQDEDASIIAETLAPKIQEMGDGKTAAIIIRCKEPRTEPQKIQERPKVNQENYLRLIKKYLPIKNIKFNHSNKVILSLALIILIIFILSVYFAIGKQESAKVKALFDKAYPEAQKKYTEGKSLLDLNKNLARENFRGSQKILQDVKDKFAKKTKEEQQILELLAKVNNALQDNSPEKIAKTQDKTKITINLENGSGLEGVAGKAADFLKGKGYNVLSTTNADNYKYIGVTIKVKSSTSAYLDLIKKDLSEKYTIVNTSSSLSKDSASDALVIVGK